MGPIEATRDRLALEQSFEIRIGMWCQASMAVLVMPKIMKQKFELSRPSFYYAKRKV